MPAHRTGRDLLSGGSLLKDGSRVWRVGYVDAPLDYPPRVHLPDPSSGRFDDPLKEYRTLYCARYQSIALRETLQQFRRSTTTLSRLKSVFGDTGLPPARVPDDWREKHVLAPARIRLVAEARLAVYEDPELLRKLEEGFAEFLESQDIAGLDISALRAKDRIVSQFFGRFLHDRGHAGIVFESGLPPGGPCVALFEDHAWLEPSGSPRPLTKPFPALRAISRELGLELKRDTHDSMFVSTGDRSVPR